MPAGAQQIPAPLQRAGVLLSLAGTLVYFGPITFPASQLVAVGIVAVGVLAFTAATMLGRSVNRDDGLPALTVTVVSMGIGSGALLAVAVVHDGIPRLTLASWLVVWWLAVVNTAVAFTVWNYTMRRLVTAGAGWLQIDLACSDWMPLRSRRSDGGVAGLRTNTSARIRGRHASIA